jgi:hypothetical protein
VGKKDFIESKEPIDSIAPNFCSSAADAVEADSITAGGIAEVGITVLYV